MNKITSGLFGLATFALMSVGASSASAQGIHIRTAGVHLDIGRPHARAHLHRYYRAPVPVVRYTRPAYNYCPTPRIPSAYGYGNYYNGPRYRSYSRSYYNVPTYGYGRSPYRW